MINNTKERFNTTRGNSWKVERWEDIPKKKLRKLRKTFTVSNEIELEKERINYYKENVESKSLRILERIYKKNKHIIENGNMPDPHKNLYNIICDVEILRISYRKLSKNKGAMTLGAVDITATNINENFLVNLSNELKEEKFKWNPARRAYVEKPGKTVKRPLGINDYKNKIVQEAIRMVLEVIYEPEFEYYETNMGFRPKRDCAKALENIRKKASFANIVIEGDIVGAYDNVDHNILFQILKKRIKDKKLLNLIYAGFKAGIMDMGKFMDTITGIPQGGVCSPILFNIYMHEFDKFVVKEIKSYIEKLNTGKSYRIRESLEHGKLRKRRDTIIKELKLEEEHNTIIKKDFKIIMDTIKENPQIFKDETWKNIIDEGNNYVLKRRTNQNKPKNAKVIKLIEKIESIIDEERRDLLINYKKTKLSEELKAVTLKLKSTKSQDLDKTTILMFYQRYADDWTLWLRVSTEIANEIKDKIAKFLKCILKLELSMDKTKITILDENQAKFLGFSVYRQRNKKRITIVSKTCTKPYSSLVNKLRIDPDRDRLNSRFLNKGYYTVYKYFDNIDRIKPMHIGFLTVFEINQIIEKYNQFMIGLGNYYITVIREPHKLSKYHYILYYSCLKTICCKLKTTIRDLIKRNGFADISDRRPNDKKNTRHYLTDLRYCFKYTFNNEEKWITLLNYKEFMYRIMTYRKKFIEKINKGEEFITPQIDFLSMYKMNFRAKYKMNAHCAICASTEKLHNHHIKKVKRRNGRIEGYKGFDKVIASLGRKQITICEECHHKVHRGEYDGISLEELYNSRLVNPENYIRMKKIWQEDYYGYYKGKEENKEINIENKNSDPDIIIDEINRTYWNKKYNKYLVEKKKIIEEKKKNKTKSQS